MLLLLVPILVWLCQRIDAYASVYCGALQVQFVRESYSGSGWGQPCGKYYVRKLRPPSARYGKHTEWHGGIVPAPPLYESSSIKNMVIRAIFFVASLDIVMVEGSKSFCHMTKHRSCVSGQRTSSIIKARDIS